MARLSIATFSSHVGVCGGTPQQTLSVSLSGTSAQSSAITGPSGGWMIARLCSDADCDIAEGTNPTAVAGTSRFLPANSIEYIRVLVGDKIAGVTHS